MSSAVTLASVRKVTFEDVPKLALALGRAFDSDPPMCWFIQDDDRRVELARQMFDVMLRNVHISRDACYTTEEISGGALWVPPGRWRLGFLQQLKLLPGMIRVFGCDLPRAQRGLTVMDAGHPRRPHWYLDSLGVEVRVGHHCARPTCVRFGVPAMTRVSFYLYTTNDEVDALVRGLAQVRKVFS